MASAIACGSGSQSRPFTRSTMVSRDTGLGHTDDGQATGVCFQRRESEGLKPWRIGHHRGAIQKIHDLGVTRAELYLQDHVKARGERAKLFDVCLVRHVADPHETSRAHFEPRDGRDHELDVLVSRERADADHEAVAPLMTIDKQFGIDAQVAWVRIDAVRS